MRTGQDELTCDTCSAMFVHLCLRTVSLEITDQSCEEAFIYTKVELRICCYPGSPRVKFGLSCFMRRSHGMAPPLRNHWSAPYLQKYCSDFNEPEWMARVMNGLTWTFPISHAKETCGWGDFWYICGIGIIMCVNRDMLVIDIGWTYPPVAWKCVIRTDLGFFACVAPNHLHLWELSIGHPVNVVQWHIN